MSNDQRSDAWHNDQRSDAWHNDQRSDAWHKGADRYSKLAAERADEGTGVQLACLVLAYYCMHEWSGDYGGPTPEMVALAENTVGERLDEVIASLMNATP